MIHDLENYQPYNEQETTDLMLMQQGGGEEALSRTHPHYHFTSSAWIVNANRTKVLMAYHKVYQSYAWLGAHNDGDTNFLRVCLKAIQKESGLTRVKVLSSVPFSIEILSVQGHMKNEHYVSSHLHYNLTYLIEADENESWDANVNLKWIDVNDLDSWVQEEWMNEHVYKKLNQKLERWNLYV